MRSAALFRIAQIAIDRRLVEWGYKVWINNIPALVQIMAWRRPGDKQLSEPMMVSYWRIYASFGLNELIEYHKTY